MSDSGSDDFDETPGSTPPPVEVIRADYYNNNKRRAVTKHAFFPRAVLQAAAHKAARLVPIRLEIDEQEIKLKDCFMWNLNETLITPDAFAEIFVEDLKIGNPKFKHLTKRLVSGQITAQCDLFRDSMYWDETPSILKQTQPNTNAETYGTEYDDIIDTIIIKLNLQVGDSRLRDQFEWSLTDNHVTPEEFAKQLAADLGIGGEMVQLIAQSIREQVLLARLDPTNKDVPIAPFQAGPQMRGGTIDWEPEYLDSPDAEMDRLDREYERGARRVRRAQRNTMSAYTIPPPAFFFERTKEVEARPTYVAPPRLEYKVQPGPGTYYSRKKEAIARAAAAAQAAAEQAKGNVAYIQ